MQDPMGDRMKVYEGSQSPKLMPLLPAFARLDGRAFHTFCKGLEKPYDPRLTQVMQTVTEYLVESTGARLGYTQSDEITLVWLPPRFDSELPFGGKIQKMTSNLAASATIVFYLQLATVIPEKCGYAPTFDCRVWNVPNVVEAANVFLWREYDATRNSISSAAQAVYSARQLHMMNQKDMLDMLIERGINWNDYPADFKRGSYFKRVPRMVEIPKEHRTEGGPTEVARSKIEHMLWEPLSTIEDRPAFLFDKLT